MSDSTPMNDDEDPYYTIELFPITDDEPRAWLATAHDENDESVHLDFSGSSISDALRRVAEALEALASK